MLSWIMILIKKVLLPEVHESKYQSATGIIKRFYLPDDSESEDVDQSNITEDNNITDCKNWIMGFRHLTK